MLFTPLGRFNVAAPLAIAAVAEAKAFLAKLPAVPHGALERIYLHWSVGHFNQNFNDYNGAVRYDGRFHLDVVGDPRDNAIGVNDNEPHPHTYHRNTGAFGFCTDDMVGASEHDFGAEPVTVVALEYLCAGVAAVALAYGIDIAGTSAHGPFFGEPNVLTHAEAANRVGAPPQYAAYGPPPIGTNERWDLASFAALPPGRSATEETAKVCGDALRARAHAYKLAIA